MWNPGTRDCECNKGSKIGEYIDIKNCLCVKRLIGKLGLQCEDEILNKAETLLNDEKVACVKSNCTLFH